jgi:hypothetical protein
MAQQKKDVKSADEFEAREILGVAAIYTVMNSNSTARPAQSAKPHALCNGNPSGFCVGSLSPTASATGLTGSTAGIVQAVVVIDSRQETASVAHKVCHAPRGFPLIHGDPLVRCLATVAATSTDARFVSGDDRTGLPAYLVARRAPHPAEPKLTMLPQAVKKPVVLYSINIMNSAIENTSGRLAASKKNAEERLKQSGLSSAEHWCSHDAEYYEIKRLATFRESLGITYREIVDEEVGYISIAHHAEVGGEDYGWEEARVFWDNVFASDEELASFIFLDAFLEGCELFWSQTAKNI